MTAKSLFSLPHWTLHFQIEVDRPNSVLRLIPFQPPWPRARDDRCSEIRSSGQASRSEWSQMAALATRTKWSCRQLQIRKKISGYLCWLTYLQELSASAPGKQFFSSSCMYPRRGTVLTTVLRKFDKNPTKIPIAWCFKLANSVTSCDKIESGSLSPSENLSHCLTQ